MRKAQIDLLTLPKDARQAHNIHPSQQMTLLDPDSFFVLSPQPSQVDALAERIADELAERGKTLASMRHTQCELRGKHS